MPTLTETDARARAEAEARAYCGWHVAPSREAVVTLDGPGSPVLLLPSLYVTSVDSITELGTLVEPDSYAWSASGVVRRGPGPGLGRARWTGTLRGVEVAFTHGYAEWPLDVRAVVDRLTSRAVEGSGLLTQVGQISYATGEDGLPVSGTLTSADRAILDRYKLPHLA